MATEKIRGGEMRTALYILGTWALVGVATYTLYELARWLIH